jgi:RHS repeat-associated protein
MATTTVQLASSTMNPFPITMSSSATDCIDEPVVSQGAGTGTTIYYFYRNQQYSITAVTTSTGTIAERYAYTAYGQPTILDASGTVLQTSNFSLRYSFTGREWDATLGLHHFRARWMSPSAGRFLGRDPIGFEGSPFNLYEFLGGEALTEIDPTGKSCDCGEPAECIMRCGPAACNAARYTFRPRAERLAKVSFPRSDPSNRAFEDALRHCLWSCYIAESFGEDSSFCVTQTHEECVPNHEDDYCMDWFNNMKGRQVATQSGGCYATCYKMLSDGELQTKKGCPAGADKNRNGGGFGPDPENHPWRMN